MNKKLKTWIFIVWALIIFSLLVLFYLAATTATMKKPAIYLYPIEDCRVAVQVSVNGELTKTIPEYGDGWDVFATKEGIIEDKYDYLFYEANLRKIELPNEGWIVEYENLDSWFDENLKLMGLNDKELSQFKEYWMEELPEENYYLIKLLSDEFLEENMALSISPEPDILIRREFYFKSLSEKIEIANPEIITPQRDGFVVVEWGGILED